MMSRSHVSLGSQYIMRPQMMMAMIGTNGTIGVRNGRTSSGLLTRNTQMPALTITNASNVPIDTSSPSNPMGKNPATSIATMPVMMVARYGVWTFGWILPNTGGSNPSRAIE